MRSLNGWKALVCLAAVATLVVPVAMTVANDSVGSQGANNLRRTETREAAALDYQYYPRANYVWPFATGPHYGQVRMATPREPGGSRIPQKNPRQKETASAQPSPRLFERARDH